VPVAPKLEWDAIKEFARWVAERFVAAYPDRFTSNMAKRARTGRIFIDYLRNGEGATAVAAYSTRARANAPVSTPIDWTELGRDVRFDYFTIKNVPARLRRLKHEPWAEFSELRQSVTAAMMKNVGYKQ